MGLVLFHVLNNWIFVRTQVTILGWDRPAHLVRTLIYNDMLQQVNLRNLFEVMTWSWNRPPLSHLAAVPLFTKDNRGPQYLTMQEAMSTQ